MATSSIIPKVIVVTGPTASGKSGLSLDIAQKLRERNRKCVIINADSQQMYRELRVLTARPTFEEEAAVPHKLYGTMGAHEACSAGIWLRLARMEIDWARGNGVTPIVVGGTGLYISALLNGIHDMPEVPAIVRAQAAADYEHMGKEGFAARLREIDPAFFERLAVYDRQRLIRCYEVWLASGKTLSWWQAQKARIPYRPEETILFQVDISRDALYSRCNSRLRHIVEQGALEEVSGLMHMDISTDMPIMKTIGIKEFSSYLRQEISLEQAIMLASQATRNYAKRQLTWFRHQLQGAILANSAEKMINNL